MYYPILKHSNTIEETKNQIMSLGKEGKFSEREETIDGYTAKHLEFVADDGSIKIKQSFTHKAKTEDDIKMEELWKVFEGIRWQKNKLFSDLSKVNWDDVALLLEKEKNIYQQIKQIQNGNIKSGTTQSVTDSPIGSTG